MPYRVRARRESFPLGASQPNPQAQERAPFPPTTSSGDSLSETSATPGPAPGAPRGGETELRTARDIEAQCAVWKQSTLALFTSMMYGVAI